MIVPMKVITVLCVEAHRDRTLEALRDMGALHLEPVRAEGHPSIEAARRDYEHIRMAAVVLPVRSNLAPSGRTPQKVVEAIWTLIHEREELQDERESLVHEEARIAPYGALDPDRARALEAHGVRVRLYQASPRTSPEIEGEEFIRVEAESDSQAIRFAVLSRGICHIRGATEVRMPEMGLRVLRQRLMAMEERLSAIEQDISAFGGDHDRVAALLRDAANSIEFAEARAGMGGAPSSPLIYVRGYAPEESLDQFREAARREGWGLVVDDPGEGDEVPTLVRPPRWARSIGALMDFIGVMPGYREVDISALFLVFFGLFFAMLVGDAGYGALFLAASLWGRRRFPNAPRRVFHLLNLMSGATIVWGVITGNYFGIPAGGFLSKVTIAWLQNPGNVQALCFHIGVIHLSIAHLWNAIRFGRSLQTLAQIGWLGTTWTMYFLANDMVLGRPAPSFIGPMFIVSVVLILLFMTPMRQMKTEWFNHVMLPLNLVSNFVDVVSYIRLYAVGTASAAVALSFNTMIEPMLGSWVTGLVAAVLLFLAHALNVVLALMGVMVHGVRLNTLEFSGHVGLQWTGRPYEPFRKLEHPAP
ncbi:MAG: hypothetical protein KBA51_06500 [Kiritimatiellae bacterium]|nr:hypothetical protein [Kiritimatiellia bacterium]